MKKYLALLGVIATVAVASVWLYKQLGIDSCLDIGGKWDYHMGGCDGQSALATTPVTTPPTNAGCVTIPASGLTWELKTDDGGIHDKDNTYRWGGRGAENTGTIFFDDWNSLLAAANSEKLCGFDDWRVPTIDELKTLVISTSITPMIDTTVFPLTLAEPYWSASTYQQYPEHAQTVDFGTGASNYYNGFRGNPLPVRLVRTGKTVP